MTRVARDFIVMTVFSFRCIVGCRCVHTVTKEPQERVFGLANLHPGISNDVIASRCTFLNRPEICDGREHELS
jgi:hypothetical protein